jgi:hypothetical protein
VAGGAACILLALVLLLLQGQVQEVTGPVGWSKVLPVYRLSAMPILGIWLWGVNVLIWHRTRVNHVYIFDLSPTSALSHIHLFRVLTRARTTAHAPPHTQHSCRVDVLADAWPD